MTTRTATAHWSGALSDGSGAISTETGTLSETPYSFETRFGDEGGTSGSHALAQAGHPPERAETEAQVHLKKIEGGFEIPSIHLVLNADVPGISDDEFQRIANDAKENCPLSKVLRAAEITLDATLTSS